MDIYSTHLHRYHRYIGHTIIIMLYYILYIHYDRYHSVLHVL